MADETKARIGRAALALAVGLALASAAGARPPEHRPPGGLVARYAERLGLSGESRAAVQAVVDASRVRHEALVAKIRAARTEMRELLSRPIPDADAVMAQADAIGAAETELHKNRLRAMLEIRALLTPEQRAKLVQIREERRDRRERRAECGPPED